MATFEFFEIGEHYASYRPVGQVSFEQGVAMISAAIEACGERKITRLLVNTLGLHGYKNPGTLDRYTMAARFAAAAKFGLKVVLVAPAEVIDPRRFGVTVAVNRGLNSNVFDSEPEAIAWLMAS